MGAPSSTDELEERIACHLDKGGVTAVVSAYVFGSRADGRAHSESDVDIGILMDRLLLPSRKERFDASLRLGTELQAMLATAEVDLVILNDAPPLIARRIVTEGLRVFCSDRELDHAFVRDVQLRAADLQPYLERMQKIKLEALRPR